MQDKDPRPMPIEVQSAYRDPIDLLGLLETDVYSTADRIAVRDALLSSLLARYGDAWIEVGGKEMPVTKRVKALRKNIVGGIELLLDVPDYRGREETLPLLAQAMEPRWAEWWKTFDWGDERLSSMKWRETARHLLGSRQFVWLAAQYARLVIDRVRSRERNVYLHAIKAAEKWAQVPTAQNRQIVLDAGVAARQARLAVPISEPYAKDILTMAMNIAEAVNDTNSSDWYANMNVSHAVKEENHDSYVSAKTRHDIETVLRLGERRIGNITRSLITPSLVTSAIGSARSNPSRSGASKTAQLIREVRSAADGRALSISGLKVGRALLVRVKPALRGAEWVIASHVRVHGEDEFAFFISDRAGTWPKRLLELHTVRGVRDFEGAFAQMGYQLVAG